MSIYKNYIKPTLIFVVLTVIVSGLLAFTYQATGVGNLSTGLSAEDLAKYQPQVAPQAGIFTEKPEVKVEDPNFVAVYSDGSQYGAIHVSVKGYGDGGLMKILIGFDQTGTITGLAVTDSMETPGLGSKTANPDYLAKYVGISAPITLVKSGAKEGEVDAITGATISSTALNTAVNQALSWINQIKGEVFQ